MKILFIHGLASSGAYKMADTLRILMRPCTVIAPDVPIEPDKAYAMLSELCRTEKPDVIVGHSLGAFWAQKLRGFKKLLVNPDFQVHQLLRVFIGEMKYLSPRRDGATSFLITEEICKGYERIAATQFDGLTDKEIRLTAGAFADKDELVRCGDEFEAHYPGRGHSYPGGHLPCYREVKESIVPILSALLDES